MKLLIILILLKYILCFQSNKIIKFFRIPHTCEDRQTFEFITKNQQYDDGNTTSSVFVRHRPPILPTTNTNLILKDFFNK
jgi:hypothetical protein